MAGVSQHNLASYINIKREAFFKKEKQLVGFAAEKENGCKADDLLHKCFHIHKAKKKKN